MKTLLMALFALSFNSAQSYACATNETVTPACRDLIAALEGLRQKPDVNERVLIGFVNTNHDEISRVINEADRAKKDVIKAGEDLSKEMFQSPTKPSELKKLGEKVAAAAQKYSEYVEFIKKNLIDSTILTPNHVGDWVLYPERAQAIKPLAFEDLAFMAYGRENIPEFLQHAPKMGEVIQRDIDEASKTSRAALGRAKYLKSFLSETPRKTVSPGQILINAAKAVK